MSDPPLVDELYNEFSEIINHLEEDKRPSLQNVADENLKKLIIIAAASFFENEIKKQLLVFIEERSNKDSMLISFVEQQIDIDRKFYKLFDINEECSNCNKFFKLFGDEFNKKCQEDLKSNNELRDSMKAFIEVINTRNKIIHNNYLEQHIEKTCRECYDLYKKAENFIGYILKKLKLHE